MSETTGCSSPISAGPSTPLASMARTSTHSFLPRATSRASPMSKHLQRETDMSKNTSIQRVAIIGTGVIGASWAALFLAKGLEVVATDVAPGAEAALRSFVEAAWPALKRFGLSQGASQLNLKFTAALTQAV